MTIPVAYGALKTDDGFYINIVDKLYAPETIIIHMITYKYENDSFVPYVHTDDFSDGTWSLKTESTDDHKDIAISCNKVDSIDKFDYDCRYDNDHLKIDAINERQEILSSLSLLFDRGAWVVK